MYIKKVLILVLMEDALVQEGTQVWWPNGWS